MKNRYPVTMTLLIDSCSHHTSQFFSALGLLILGLVWLAPTHAGTGEDPWQAVFDQAASLPRLYSLLVSRDDELLHGQVA